MEYSVEQRVMKKAINENGAKCQGRDARFFSLVWASSQKQRLVVDMYMGEYTILGQSCSRTGRLSGHGLVADSKLMPIVRARVMESVVRLAKFIATWSNLQSSMEIFFKLSRLSWK